METDHVAYSFFSLSGKLDFCLIYRYASCSQGGLSNRLELQIALELVHN